MRKDVDMLNGPLVPSIIRFAIPVILTTMLQSMFTTIDLVVIGEAVPLGKTWVELSAAFDDELRNAFESGRLETVTETTFWQWLGLSPQTSSPQLYTPAALAQLAGVPAAAIRHWHRAGLLKPESQVGKLPYFQLELFILTTLTQGIGFNADIEIFGRRERIVTLNQKRGGAGGGI